MNTALQTQETSPHPIPVKPRAAKKATNELKMKSRTTTAKKSVIAGAKNPAPKRKAAGKVRSCAKAASRKMKPSVIKDNPPEQIAVARETIFSTPELAIQSDSPIHEARPAISEPAAGQIAFSTTPVALDPMSFDDQLEIESSAAESIPDLRLIEPVAAESLQDSALETFNEPNPPTETVALREADVPTSEDPAIEAATETPLTPLARFWKSMASQLTELWNWAQEKFRSHQVRKRLRVCETVSLGEKRFLAVVQVDGEQFLVGGSSSSVSTLAHLERSRDFSDVFQRHCEQDLSRA
jgi:hypothetical protein